MSDIQQPPQKEPFLVIPLAKGAPFDGITEGWFYSDEELAIHGHKTHFGVDFAAPRGTPVYAAADGLALASYHFGHATHTVGEQELPIYYQEKVAGFGLGFFVQVWHPQADVFTLYGHLEKPAENLPFFQPTLDGETYQPTVLYQPVEAVVALCRPVLKGDLIGTIGDSGLTWDYQESSDLSSEVRNFDQFPSWDETHLHFEAYTRKVDGSLKELRWDPFDLYGQADAYATALDQPARGLWLPGADGTPQFAV